MSTSERLRILIADDHEGYRNELRHTLAREADLQVVAAESNGADAVRRVRALRPHGLKRSNGRIRSNGAPGGSEASLFPSRPGWTTRRCSRRRTARLLPKGRRAGASSLRNLRFTVALPPRATQPAHSTPVLRARVLVVDPDLQLLELLVHRLGRAALSTVSAHEPATGTTSQPACSAIGAASPGWVGQPLNTCMARSKLGSSLRLPCPQHDRDY
ncbi:MAG: hypothetical protein LC797_25535 [Chloroflexi bacterium]|nr:hypothetical protein [Chloroflexota bacterium]